jgi:hypothetical protein
MRQARLTITALALCGLGTIAAESNMTFRFVELTEAEREVAALTQSDTPAALWVWTDKYVYQPGEPISARWTVKPNNDFYPYTIVAYRQNNQTGAKTYLSGNSQDPADIFGNTVDNGFQIVRLPQPSKGVLVGQGGMAASSPISAPNELGMHTIVVQLRDYTGRRVVKAAYFKFGIVSGFEDLPPNITENRTLTNDKAYRIRGIVAVRNNATLTISPGTFLIGQPGSQPPSVLLITTQGRIHADGTRSRPIIMTSSQPFGQRQRGDWGGLILLGTAPINDPGGQLTIEGLPELPETRYGGTNANHDCGTLRYVRVEFAGSLLRPNEETNAFTWGACGKATVSEYLQAHYGLDDAFEWFGGNSDAKYLVGTYAADDYIDVQIGYTGRIQHVVLAANEDLSNRGVEADNYERDFAARPLGKFQLWNATFVGSAARGFDETDAPCLYYRRGAGGSSNNVLCYNWTTRGLGGANFDSIQPNITSGEFAANGVLMFDNGKEANRPNTVDGQVLDVFQPFARGQQGQGRNFWVSDPMLRRPLERSDPDFRPLLGSPVFRANWVQPPDDGFYDQWATWIGAFGDVDWTEEWTTFLQEQDIRP